MLYVCAASSQASHTKWPLLSKLMSHHKVLGFLHEMTWVTVFQVLKNKKQMTVNTQKANEYLITCIHLGESESHSTSGNVCLADPVNRVAGLCLSHRAKDQAGLEEVWHSVAT